MNYRYPIQRPFIKPTGFCPNPVVKFGIPSYADSIVNRKVIGTPAWREYWKEQIYYCINGYETAGVFIPGRYYHYLNFTKTSSVKSQGAVHPSYIDFQYEYFLLVEEAKRLGKNIIAPKGRRKGMSVMNAAIVDHGYRFLQNYHVGIAAGKKEYAEDFLDKWLYLDSMIAPELRLRKLSDNYDDIISGWTQKGEDGVWETKGFRNTMYVRTMFSDPEVFKGKYLNDVIFEESGEFDNLIKTFQATKACTMDGSIQYGTMYIYGTGGNIKTGSSGFQQMWYDYEKYNCLRYFVDGPKYFMPCVAGSVDDKGIVNEDIPNLLHISKDARLGMEDEKRAIEIIEIEKAKLIKSKNLTDYWEYCKDNPVDIKEVFRRAASNNFSVEVLNDQQHEILSKDVQYSKYRLEWETNEDGTIQIPRKVIAIPAKEDEDENECVLILADGHPMKGYRNLYCAGVDSYDQDKSLTSSSLGAMVVLQRRSSLQPEKSMRPVLLIRCRPSRKEKFYEMCMKASVYYDLQQSTLIDVRCPLIIEYYKANGCSSYLGKRPKKFESENSEQKHDYGVSLNVTSKPQMVALLQTYYLDHGHKIWFPQMIEEALNYDVLEKESDNDTVDALGIGLMQDVDLGIEAFNEEDMKIDPVATVTYIEDRFGNILPMEEFQRLRSRQNDPDLILLEHRMLIEGSYKVEEEDDF